MAPALLICLVDDAPDFRRLVAQLFAQYLPQHDLYQLESGQALLDALPDMNQLPNLILLDQHMPDRDGLQTLQALKRQKKFQSIPVVLISSDASHSEVYHGYEAGAHAFLVKPLELMDLKDMLVQAISYANKPPGQPSRSNNKTGD